MLTDGGLEVVSGRGSGRHGSPAVLFAQPMRPEHREVDAERTATVARPTRMGDGARLLPGEAVLWSIW
jgi:hypothetical protein